jgi:hypothetical protein
MASMLFSFLVYASGIWGALSQARLEQTFQAWEQAQSDTRSLVVRFTVENDDSVLRVKTKCEGRLQLLRLSKNSYLGRFDLSEPSNAEFFDSAYDGG